MNYKKNKRTCAFFSLMFILFLVPSASRSDLFFKNENLAIYPRFGYSYNFHISNFNYFKNSIPCGHYKNGNGYGYFATIALEKKISDKLHLSFSINYTDKSAEFFFDTTYKYRNYENLISEAIFRNTISSELYFLELQPDLRLILFETHKIALRSFIGARFSFPIVAKFSQFENILSPSDAYYPGESNNPEKKSKFRQLAENNIGNLRKINFGSSFGFDNTIKLNNYLAFTQQINFDYNFVDITTDKNTDWKSHSLGFSLGIRYSFEASQNDSNSNSRKKEEIQYELKPTSEPKQINEQLIVHSEAPPALVPQSPELAAVVVAPKITLIAKDYSGEIYNKLDLLATQPIVNSVFFENNSSDLPRYLRFDKLSPDDYFKKNALELHDYVLLHIANLLQENSASFAIIEGYTAGEKFESGGLTLALERAKIVKKSLVNLGIDSNKLKIKTRLTPKNISNNNFVEGIAENQRVDIYIQNAPIQKYINFINSSELVASRQYFAEIINSVETPNLYNLRADSTISIKKPGIYTFYIKKQITNFAEEKELINESNLSVSDAQKSILDTINYNKLLVKNTSKNYNNFEAIIRFDYNSSDLSTENKQLLNTLVEVLPENHTIQIFGSADSLGSITRNEQLISERAKTTYKYINSLIKHKKNLKLQIETEFNNKKFVDSVPAGRFLNRCVIIKIK